MGKEKRTVETLCSTAKGPKDQEKGRLTTERCADMLQHGSRFTGFVLVGALQHSIRVWIRRLCVPLGGTTHWVLKAPKPSLVNQPIRGENSRSKRKHTVCTHFINTSTPLAYPEVCLGFFEFVFSMIGLKPASCSQLRACARLPRRA